MDKQSFKILVADDDDIARDVIASLLSKEGYAVIIAKDGLEAISRIRREEVHLIITDLKMPGADGIEVLKAAVLQDSDTAVVILTAYGTLDTTLEAMKTGAYDYLTKPFKVQEIVSLADRTYRRALLIADNRELKRTLRDTYRDIEILKTVSASSHPEISAAWLERIKALRSLNVLTTNEADVLKERLVEGNGKR